MSFFTNPAQQMTLEDALFSLTARERKALENSWAKIFADELFPKIEEEPFRVLYCENNGRPNTPINVMVGASIMADATIKKLSRLELLYTCIADLVIRLKKESVGGISESLLHYAADHDFNQVFYYARNSDYAEKSLQLLADADALSAFCGERCNDYIVLYILIMYFNYIFKI